MDQDEFEKALAAQVATEEDAPEEPEETPAEEAETPEEPEAEAEVEETEETEEEDEAPEYPDDVRDFLAKYDGDVVKALQAANHAQETIGRQGNELGELRRMVEEIRDRPEPKKPSTIPAVTPEMSEAISDNPAAVAQWAIENEQGHIYEAAMSEWFDTDPRAASRFEMALTRELIKQELQGQIAPDIETMREQQKARAVSDAHRSLSSKYPDFQQTLETATEAELAGIDRDLLATAQQSNPAAALELVYRWVRAGREQQAAQKAEHTEKVRQTKREAAVVTADTSNTQTETNVMDKLKEAMLSPEPQSVAHGLVSE